MKIRIKGNTVRLRLSQSEVTALETEGHVSESITFGPDQILTYTLSRAAAEKISASYAASQIRIVLPDAVARAWTNGDEISIIAEQDNAVNGGLSILVEKDFRCLTERAGENEEDLFPHPKEGEVNC